jgi:hypothetical protein
MKVLIIALALLQLLTPFASADDALTRIGTIPLPDVSGRFDHLAIDIKGKRLFVAALGNNTLEVLDLSKRERITTISDVKRPTAAIFIPEKNQIGIASSANGCFKIYSGADYKSVATIKGLDDADNVRLDLDKNTVVIGYTDGALAFINAKNWQKTGNIKLEGHPESFQLAGQSGRIYINVPTRSEVSIIDRDQKRVTGSIPMTNYKANFPMALDESNERLFIGCRTPPRLVAFDAKIGNPIGELEISADTDDLFYDAKRHRIYISCGEGTIDIVNASVGQRLERIQRITTRQGARTSIYSPDLDTLFLAVPNHAGHPAEIQIYKPN